MNTSVGLILKVMLLSAGLSFAIKAFGPTLLIAPTTMVVLVAVLLPTMVMSVLLWRRA